MASAPNLTLFADALDCPAGQLRHHCDPVAAEFGGDAEPLVNDRPEHAVRAPCLHHHRSLCE